MSDVVLFTPLAEKTAQENLDAFIGLCKSKLAVFGKDLPFDDIVWDITDTVQDRGKRSRKRIYFSSWDTVNDLDPSQCLSHLCLLPRRMSGISMVLNRSLIRARGLRRCAPSVLRWTRSEKLPRWISMVTC